MNYNRFVVACSNSLEDLHNSFKLKSGKGDDVNRREI